MKKEKRKLKKVKVTGRSKVKVMRGSKVKVSGGQRSRSEVILRGGKGVAEVWLGGVGQGLGECVGGGGL